MKTKQEYINSLAAELKDWSARIDLLTAKMENEEAHETGKYIEELNDLHAKHQKATETLKELLQADGNGSATVHGEEHKLWGDPEIGLPSSTNINRIVTDGYRFWDDLETG